MRLSRITLFFIAIIMAVGFYRLTDFLLRDVEAQTFQATEESMVETVQVLASIVENEASDEAKIGLLRKTFSQAHQRDFQAKIHKWQKNSLGLHCYLTDKKGIVLFDSAELNTASTSSSKVNQVEASDYAVDSWKELDSRRDTRSHAQETPSAKKTSPSLTGRDLSLHNDVFLTLRGQYGSRSSRTDPDDPHSSILYVAAPVNKDEALTHVLTLYKNQSDVLPFIQERRRTILTSATLIGLGILALITAVFMWLFRPVGKLTTYARAISEGKRLPAPEVGVGREVNTLRTALVQMRESLEGRRYAEQYIHTLTHEIKSPLAAIKGAAELLQEEMPQEDRDRFLKNIHTETARSETLINSLLTLAKVEGRSHLDHTEPLQLDQIVREAIRQCQPLAENKNLAIHSDLTTELHLEGDRSILLSAIGNLIENAIDFSPQNGTISLTAEEDESHHRLLIEDEGPGLPNFALERAFERFFSHREGITRKGSGLGLSFVKEAAQLHKGSARINNRPDRSGARVTFTIAKKPARLQM